MLAQDVSLAPSLLAQREVGEMAVQDAVRVADVAVAHETQGGGGGRGWPTTVAPSGGCRPATSGRRPVSARGEAGASTAAATRWTRARTRATACARRRSTESGRRCGRSTTGGLRG